MSTSSTAWTSQPGLCCADCSRSSGWGSTPSLGCWCMFFPQHRSPGSWRLTLRVCWWTLHLWVCCSNGSNSARSGQPSPQSWSGHYWPSQWKGWALRVKSWPTSRAPPGRCADYSWPVPAWGGPTWSPTASDGTLPWTTAVWCRVMLGLRGIGPASGFNSAVCRKIGYPGLLG